MLERNESVVFMADNANFGEARPGDRRSKSPTRMGRVTNRRESSSPFNPAAVTPTQNRFGVYWRGDSYNVEDSGLGLPIKTLQVV